MTNVNQHHSTVQSVQINRQWTLATRPLGAPTLGNFNFVKSNKPSPMQNPSPLMPLYSMVQFRA
ncbi:MAG: hypothetical protein ACI89T_002340 [Cognaticolwellia sp.]|jgi:hypothetical protein